MLLPIANEPLPAPLAPPLNADRLFPAAPPTPPTPPPPPGSREVCIDEAELDEAAEEPEPAKEAPLPVYKSFFMAYTSVCSDFVVSLRNEGMMLPAGGGMEKGVDVNKN